MQNRMSWIFLRSVKDHPASKRKKYQDIKDVPNYLMLSAQFGLLYTDTLK